MGIALTTGVMAFGIYQIQLPPAVDVRTVEAGDADVQSSERAATWMAATAVSGIALLSKSSEVFIVGGLVVVGMAWMYRHADAVNPITKKATGFLTADQAAQAQMPEAPAATGSTAPQYAAVI
jgi:hypothetical protein